MRTLDSDLREYFEHVPDEILKMFAKYNAQNWRLFVEGNDDFIYEEPHVMEGIDKIPTITSHDLQQICDCIHAEGRAVAYDKFKDKNAEPNENEKHMIENKFERKIPEYDVQFMARSMLLMRYGKKFAQLSVKNMEKDIKSSQKKYGLSNESDIDTKYNINIMHKKGVKNLVKCQNLLKKIIFNMSLEEILSAKNAIKLLRNDPGIILFESHEKEMKYVTDIVFGDTLTEQNVQDICHMASIAEIEKIIDEKYQMLEKKQKHANILNKIKSFLQIGKVKYLPEAHIKEEDENKNLSHDEYIKSVQFSVPNIVNTQNNNRFRYKVQIVEDYDKLR